MDATGQLDEPTVLTEGKKPGVHWIGDRMDPRVSLDDLK
jgi:hypothetical protein